MKYNEIERIGNKLVLDYITPKWYYPLLITMTLGLLGSGVYLVFFAGQSWFFLLICVVSNLLLFLYIVQYTRKRKIIIDHDKSTISYDSLERSLASISTIVSLVHDDSIRNGLEDRRAPGVITHKQKYTTFETFIVFNDNTAIRVYFGTMKKSESEVERFEKYLNLR